MATITIVQAAFIGNAVFGAQITRGGAEAPGIKETASQTYAKGAPVYYDSNGTIAVATAASNVVDLIAGFAAAAATGTTGAQVRYRPIRPFDRYIVNIKGTSTTTTARGQVGDLTNFDLHTGNLVVANVEGTTDTKVSAIITGLYHADWGFSGADAVGDTNGRLIVEFIDNKALQR